MIRRKAFTASEVARHRRFYELQAELTRRLAAAGVKILAGTDTAAPLMPAGFSLHYELQDLAAAGLSRVEVLRSATTHAAAALGAEGRLGVLAPGAQADMVLVAADPHQDLGTLAEPLAVMVRGVWRDAHDLADLLDAAR